MVIIKLLWTDRIFKVIYLVVYVFQLFVCFFVIILLASANAQKCDSVEIIIHPEVNPTYRSGTWTNDKYFRVFAVTPSLKSSSENASSLTKSLWLACTCFCLEVWNGYRSGTCGCTPSAQVTLGDRRADGHGNKLWGVLHHAMDLGITAGVTSRSTGGRGLTDGGEECRPRAFVWSRQLIPLAVLEQIEWRGFLFLSFH